MTDQRFPESVFICVNLWLRNTVLPERSDSRFKAE